ncbi:hypothetical protein FRC08_005412 [Ceratobasidium sp. 394]|nr:hypothetical protein FRC08_005412 [Ceratobasidium sp. 394]
MRPPRTLLPGPTPTSAEEIQYLQLAPLPSRTARDPQPLSACLICHRRSTVEAASAKWNAALTASCAVTPHGPELAARHHTPRGHAR